MKKRTILIAAALSAILAAAADEHVHAGPGTRMHGDLGFGHAGFGFLHQHLGKLKDELDLTDAQAAQLHAIFRETRQQNAPYRQQMHGTLKSVAQTLIADPNDVAGAQALLDRQEEAHRAVRNNVVLAALKALNVLTPEQRTKLAGLLAEHAARMESRRK